MGHRASSYDPDFFGSSGTFGKIEQKLRKGPTAAKQAKVHNEFLGILAANKWDLVFVMGQNFFAESTMAEARKRAGSQARFVFHSHDNMFSNGVLKGEDFFSALSHYDCVFTTKSQNVSLYQSMGQKKTFFLPSAYEPSVHRPIPATESRIGRQIPVSFIGTFDISRVEIVDAVGWDKLEVWGDHWQRYERVREHQNRIHPAAVYYHQFADITSHSSIALGLLRKEAMDRHTQRTFEIPACGALQLAPRTPEILEFFDDKKEIACFDTLEELKSKVDYFLTHETERRKIAEAGHRRCIAGKHTYQDRTEQIVASAFEKKYSRAG